MSDGGFPEDTRALDAWAARMSPGYRGPERGDEISDRPVEPDLSDRDAERRAMCCAASRRASCLKSAHMVEREFRVMRALNGAGYPAPRALALCEDESVAGSVFYLMSHVEGRIFWDPGMAGIRRARSAPASTTR